MSSASIKKIIPCKKNQLIEMVLDIEKYPEFVPWCIEGKIYNKNESNDLIVFNGDLKVGKSFLNETFSSQVSYYKEKDKIIVNNLEGPLKHLKNEWLFSEINNVKLIGVTGTNGKTSFVTLLDRILNKYDIKSN